MIRAGGDQWTLQVNTDRNIGFCIWVLISDGLHSPPFTAHPDGDGSLRRVGLDSANWQRWFAAVVQDATDRQNSTGRFSRQATLADPIRSLYDSDLRDGPDLHLLRRAQDARTAPALWPTGDSVRQRLWTLWPLYLDVVREQSVREFNDKRRGDQAESQTSRARATASRIWREIGKYRHLPPIHIYLIHYQVPVLTAFPPSSAVIGLPEPSPSSEDYVDLILDAAATLSGG